MPHGLKGAPRVQFGRVHDDDKDAVAIEQALGLNEDAVVVAADEEALGPDEDEHAVVEVRVQGGH